MTCLERFDCLFVFQDQTDIVQPLEQAVTPIIVEDKALLPACLMSHDAVMQITVRCGCVSVSRLVEDKIWIHMPFIVKAPVVEEVLAKSAAFNSL